MNRPNVPELPSHLVCLTSDLVGSQRADARSGVQTQLEDALEHVNAEFAEALVVPFTITLGDEWQGLLVGTADAFRVDFHLRRRLYPIRLRSGIGLGALATPLRERTSLMDGPCFHRSREAIERAKKHRCSATVLVTARPEIDDYVNEMERLLLTSFDGWTEKQFASVMAFLDHGTETKAAESLGIAQPTLHKSVHSALGKEFLSAVRARNRFLESMLDAVEGQGGTS